MTAIRVTESSGSVGVIQASNAFGGFAPTNILFKTGSVAIDGGSLTLGTDTILFVSGAIGSKLNSNTGVSVFGGDLVVSGTLYAEKQVIEVDEVATSDLLVSGSLTVSGTISSESTVTSPAISGSLTNLSDGTSYLIAGSNVQITTGSGGAITIAASADAGTSIGEAEDEDYTDGLFPDFTSSTQIGTAIDRINEVLKSLAPAPAPSLDDINSRNTGTTALLSFGSSNNQSSASPAYISVGSIAGVASAVDVNGSYAVTTSSNNIRMAVFDGDTHVTGILNEDVAYNSQGNSIQNYPAFSFGDGETGVLRLTVNGTTLKEIDLTSGLIGSGTSGIGTGSYLNDEGSGFKFFSVASSGTFSNGNEFSSFKHRSGEFVISSGSQRRGWNYARVSHAQTGSTSNTNYIEWVNDDNNDSLAAAGSSLSFEGSGSLHTSGIKYFQSGSAKYKTRVTNAYKYVYDNTNITFTTSNSAAASSSPSYSISAQSKPTIGGSEDHTKTLHLTGSGNVTSNYFLSGALTAGVNVTHPLKSNLSNSGQASTTGILMYNLSNTSTALLETFRREDYRITSGAYDTQASLPDASNVWDSTKHITASNGAHSDGLQFYNTRLYSPLSTIRAGDFRNTADGGKLDNSPRGNPNYSGESGKRTFYRWFKNETGSTKYDLTLAIEGSGSTIVSAATSLNSGRIRVFVKFPSDGTRETGWLDLATEFALDSYDDNDGAHTANGSLSFDSSLNATNYVTLGTVGVGNNEYIGLRIEADASWTGYIDSITASFGAGTGSITAIPDLDDIDCNDDGTDCNLSFGASKSVSGYTNVGTSAGFSAVDVNGLYETDSDSNNLRRSVFALDTIVEGDLNEDVSSDSNGSHVNHVANSFSDANSGSLKLEVNGSVIHTVEITGSYNLAGTGAPGSGTGTSVNSNASGFFNLSTWEAAEYNNGVPDYTEIYRTARYRVHTADQRNGWNYARVIHSIPGASDRTTNYVEWVNDDNDDSLSAAGLTLKPFKDDNIFQLSGVKYFVQPSGSIEVRVSNLYKNVYSDSASAISFTNLTNSSGVKIIQAGPGLSSTSTAASSAAALQSLSTSANSQNEDTHVTGSIRFSQSKSLSGSFTTVYSASGSLVFAHPLKANLTTTVVTSSVMHVYSASDNSNANTIEYFNGEVFRIQSGSHGAQANVTSSTYNWSSSGSLNDNSDYPGYYTGLMLYDGYLISPLNGGNYGDFRNYTDGGVLDGPDSNVNYTSLGSSTREYYRGFLNNTSDDRPSISIVLRGDATLVGKTGANIGALGANKNIFVEVKVPGKSGFLDLGKPSAGSGNTSSGDGCLSGDIDATVDAGGATNTCTFNGLTADGTVSGQEYIIIKISASKNWTGYVSQINVSWS
jgi:hypothetical protein